MYRVQELEGGGMKGGRRWTAFQDETERSVRDRDTWERQTRAKIVNRDHRRREKW